MLEEFKKLRQVDHISRRLFTDNFFDLYIWYNKVNKNFIGFQLVFSVNELQMALTAEINKTPNIHQINSGDDKFYDPTDLLDGAGYFPKKQLYSEFYKRSGAVDEYIRTNILKVIDTYQNNDEKRILKLSPLY